MARRCGRLGVQPPPDEVPAQKATRSQQRLLGTCIATPCPPNRTPEGPPSAGGWLWGGGSGCPHNSAAAPQAPHSPSSARGLKPAEDRHGVSSTTTRARGGEGAAGKRLPPPRGALPAFTGTGPAAPPRGPPSSPSSSGGGAGAPSPPGPRLLGAVTAQCPDVPGVPLPPSTTNPHRGGHQLLLCSPDTAPSSILAPAPVGTPGTPPGPGCSRSCCPHPPHPARSHTWPALTAGRWIYCNDAKISL